MDKHEPHLDKIGRSAPLCSVCRMRDAAMGWFHDSSVKLCQTCYELPRVPAFATTVVSLNAPAPLPPRLERHDPREHWQPRQFSYIPPEPPFRAASVCILWETRVVAPEP